MLIFTTIEVIILNTIGILYNQLNKKDEAIRDYTKAIEIENNANAYNNRGN